MVWALLSLIVCLGCLVVALNCRHQVAEMQGRVFALESSHARQVAFWIDQGRVVAMNCGPTPVFDVKTVLIQDGAPRSLGRRAVLEEGKRISMSSEGLNPLSDQIQVQFRDVRGMLWQRDLQGRTWMADLSVTRSPTPGVNGA